MADTWREAILELLAKLGKSSPALAVAAGKNPKTVFRYLKGGRNPSLEATSTMNRALARITGIPEVKANLDVLATLDRLAKSGPSEGTAREYYVLAIVHFLRRFEPLLYTDYEETVTKQIATWQEHRVLALARRLVAFEFEAMIVRTIDGSESRQLASSEILQLCSDAGIVVDNIRLPDDDTEIQNSLYDVVHVVNLAAEEIRKNPAQIVVRLKQETRIVDAVRDCLCRLVRKMEKTTVLVKTRDLISVGESSEAVAYLDAKIRDSRARISSLEKDIRWLTNVK